MSLAIGQTAPDFTLPVDGGGQLTLSSLRGQTVIVYFYPKDDTQGCTKEACGFRDAMPDFGRVDATIIGISPDTVASHDKFKKKYELPFTLAADTENEVATLYGVWVEKSMYGRKYMGIERSTFLIDENGLLVQEWRGVSVAGHVEAVLDAVKKLKG